MLSVVKNTKPIIFFIIALVFIAFFHVGQYYHDKSHSNEAEYQSLSYIFDTQAFKLLSAVSEVSEILLNSNDPYNEPIDSILIDTKFSCFIKINDSVTYWNNTIVNPENFNKLKDDGKVHCVKLPSGWYLYVDKKINKTKVILLDLIKSDFSMNNQLLLPGFNPIYSSSKNISLTDNEQNADRLINSDDGQFLVGLNFENNTSRQAHGNIIVLTFFVLALISLFIAFNNWLSGQRILKNKNEQKQLIFIASVIITWLLLNLFSYPPILHRSPILNSGNYNLPFTKTTGEYLLNVFFLTLISVYLYRSSDKTNNNTSPLTVIFRHSFLLLFVLIVYCYIHSATQQHNFTYVSGLFFKAPGVIIALISILLLNIGLYYIVHAYFIIKENSIPFFVPVLIIFFGEFIIYMVFDVDINVIIITFITLIVVILIKYTVWNKLSDIFLKNLLLLILLSVSSAVLINLSLKQKEDNYQKHIAEVLSTPNDQIFEKLFSEKLPGLKTDTILSELVFTDSTGLLLTEYLTKTYFNGYFNRYNIQVTNCSNDELIEIQPEGSIYNCREYFTSLINDFTISSIDTILHQFNSETEGHYYICSLRYLDNENNEMNMFIEFVSSHIPEGLGYPELLMDSESQILNLANFSFARYKDNILTYKFGDFPYITYFTSTGQAQYGKFYDYNGSRHYLTIPEDDSILIVTRKESSVTMKVVIFSVIFILLSLITVLTYLVANAKKAFSLLRLNFKTRLQTFVIGTLTLTFILIAVSTLFYIEESTREEMEKQLTEKTNSVLIELQHKLANVQDLNKEDKAFLHQLLRKFSLVFFSDINLYDKSGKLIATSRPEIFDKNLLSTYINPKAYRSIFIDNELNYITEEKIGSLEYYSSYVPINLNSYFPIGVVNLPYFARQSEYTKSYYIMLSYLLNIYVIIGIIGTLIAVTFSRYLTRPLVLLKDNISNIRIDQQNEKIEWGKSDEIGLLISEYNRMVDKLEQSAGLIARSERESAWREVAQQIAHEIKNPLTPMKLNVQYLEKAYKDNDPDFSSKLESVSNSLIAQIDVLNNVAEMFSNFAKRGGLKIENVDLKKVLNTTVGLFDKKSNVDIRLNLKTEAEELIIAGVEDDTLRVINNIVKNAVQAVENNKQGLIEISVSDNDNYIEVAISDNGKGISEESKSSIFQPYFTTKTSGTGLGLAIVKNIINETGGDVYFESAEGKGTTFFLKFKKLK